MFRTIKEFKKDDVKSLLSNGWMVKQELQSGNVIMERINFNELKRQKLRLENWFKKYDEGVQKYNREVRVGLPLTIDIESLDKEAEVNRTNLREIREYLK